MKSNPALIALTMLLLIACAKKDPKTHAPTDNHSDSAIEARNVGHPIVIHSPLLQLPSLSRPILSGKMGRLWEQDQKLSETERKELLEVIKTYDLGSFKISKTKASSFQLRFSRRTSWDWEEVLIDLGAKNNDFRLTCLAESASKSCDPRASSYFEFRHGSNWLGFVYTEEVTYPNLAGNWRDLFPARWRGTVRAVASVNSPSAGALRLEIKSEDSPTGKLLTLEGKLNKNNPTWELNWIMNIAGSSAEFRTLELLNNLSEYLPSPYKPIHKMVLRIADMSLRFDRVALPDGKLTIELNRPLESHGG